LERDVGNGGLLFAESDDQRDRREKAVDDAESAKNAAKDEKAASETEENVRKLVVVMAAADSGTPKNKKGVASLIRVRTTAALLAVDAAVAQGLVENAGSGSRSDYQLTDKGRAMAAEESAAA
jgi:hypothetical protein